MRNSNSYFNVLHSLEDLFGRNVLVSSSYFPQYFDSFIKCLPQTSKVTSKEINDKHTLSPFYFTRKTDFIYETTEKWSNGLKMNFEKLVGFGGNKVLRLSYLRYCPLCFKEDIDTLGKSYWSTN
ncbi:TniQ family protein [Virgibacillus sp. AGTR]|uniref:TniQ family protein n=1 Tax=unclassified Virgibacillus TaxID=2620237 RepID=UPI0035B1994A|nr:TniQ family protein [Virgibacillus sp. AGTR]